MLADAVSVRSPAAGVWKGALRVATLLLLVGLAALALAFFPLAAWGLALVEWVRGAGFGGVLVFALCYIGAAAFLLPGSLLTLGAGFVYGPVWGVLVVSPVSTLAASVAFLLARFLARGWVSRRVARDARFAAIDAAVGDNGLQLVALLRLSPVLPFNLLNYALGVTRVRFGDYLLGSALGMLPGTLLYVYLGSLLTSAAQLVSGRRPDAGIWQRVLYWGGLGATLLVTVVVTRLARRALRTALGSGVTSAGGVERWPPA